MFSLEYRFEEGRFSESTTTNAQSLGVPNGFGRIPITHL